MADKTKALEAAKAAAAAKPKKKRSIRKYFKDARSEFKKVVWPSRMQVFNNTTVVIISLVVSGAAVWLLDTAFGSLIKLMLGKFGQ